MELQVQEVGHPVTEVHVGGGAAVPERVCTSLRPLVGCLCMENTWDVITQFGSKQRRKGERGVLRKLKLTCPPVLYSSQGRGGNGNDCFRYLRSSEGSMIQSVARISASSTRTQTCSEKISPPKGRCGRKTKNAIRKIKNLTFSQQEFGKIIVVKKKG